jgi:hypothetical protein
MSTLERVALIFIALMAGLDLYARWTGETFSLDLLSQNQLGKRITAAGG